MAENLIVGLAYVTIVLLIWTLVIVALRWNRAIYPGAKWLLVALLVVSIMHAVSNFREWTIGDHTSMPFEDYFMLVLPAIWGCFFYVFLQAQSREKLSRSEERHRSLTDDVLDTTAAGICILDSAKHVIWINQAFEEYFKLRRNEIVGRNYARLIDDRLKHMVADPDGWAAEMHKIWEKDAIFEMETLILPGAARRERWLECRARAIHSGLYAGGRIMHFYDITERKKSAEQREELLKVLETQKADLERFVYTVSHDLKTPLITIQGFLGILEENLSQGDMEEVPNDIARIERAANRMQRLLDELLELARIGRENVVEEPVDLGQVIAEALEILQADIVNRGVEVVVHAGSPVVWGFRTRLVEVFQNLIDNAIKYLGDQPTPKIEVSVEPRDEQVVCFVRDNGIGVESKYKDKIFDLFEQLNPQYEGTGIGLTIVKRIVENHGGRIWFESDESRQGTTFWFTLDNQRPHALLETADLQHSTVDAKLPD